MRGPRGADVSARATAPAASRRTTSPTRCALLFVCLVLTGCALPRWPADGTLTSVYGLRFLGWRPDIHHGIDIAAPEGTEVRAMSAGRVSYAGTMGGYGNVIFLDHGGGTVTVYAHLSSIGVRSGQEVGHQDVIGRVGSSGSASGAHLHFEVWRDGRSTDPVLMLGGWP